MWWENHERESKGEWLLPMCISGFVRLEQTPGTFPFFPFSLWKYRSTLNATTWTRKERERERERKRMAPGVSLSLSLFVYIKVTFKTIASFSLVRETVSYECNLQSSFFFPLFFDIDNKVCLMSQCMFSGPYETWMYPFNVFWVNGQIGRSLIFISLSLFHLSHHDSPHDIRPTKKKIIYKFSSYISCKSNWLPFARVNIGNTIKLSLSLPLPHAIWA